MYTNKVIYVLSNWHIHEHKYSCNYFSAHFVFIFIFQTSLSEVLSNFVQTQYDHSVIVTVNQTECINRTTALFELTITSPVANHTLHHLLYDMNINAIGLDIGIGVIKVCEQNCTEPTVASGPSDNDDGDDEQMFIKLIFIVLVVVVALVLMLIIILCMIIYKRCVSVVN